MGVNRMENKGWGRVQDRNRVEHKGFVITEKRGLGRMMWGRGEKQGVGGGGEREDWGAGEE